MADVIRTLTVRAKPEGFAETTAALKGLQQAHDGVAASAEKTATVTDIVSRRGVSNAEAYRRQTLALDEAARAQDRIARATKVADTAFAQGSITQQDHAQRLDLIRSRYALVGHAATSASGDMVKGAGLARHEMVNMSRQIQDIGVSLSSGQSPFTVLVQQGTQVADIFATSQGTIGGFFGQILDGVGRVLTPVRLMTAGIAGSALMVVQLGSSYSAAQREIERSLMGIGRASGATVADINRIAEASTSAFGLSVSEARTAATAFAATGRIYGDNIGLATRVVSNFAIVAGVDAAEAQKILAKAMADPAKGADDLNARLGHLDGRTREHIATLQASGQRHEAQRVLILGVAEATRRATDALSLLEKAWIAVGNATDRAIEAAKRGANVVMTPTDTGRGGLEQDLSLALARRNAANPDSARWRMAAQDVERYSLALKQHDAQAQATAAAIAGVSGRLDQMSTDADNAVRAIIPQIEQLDKLREALAKVQVAQFDSNVSGRQGLGSENEAASNALRLQIALITEAKDQTARHNAEVLRIVDSYRGVAVATALGLEAQRNQLTVALAVTGAQQMAAQQAATYNQLLLEGKSHMDAMALAAGQRAIAEAQINVQAEQQLRSLREQYELITASSDEERRRIHAAQTYKNLIDQGVDSEKARAVAQQQYANANEQARRAAEETSNATERGANGARRWANESARAADEWERQQAAVKAIIDYQKYVPFASSNFSGLFDFQMGKNIWNTGSGLSQFNPDGYKSTQPTFIDSLGSSKFGPGGFQLGQGIFGGSIDPNAQGLTFLTDALLKSGGSIVDAINKVISTTGPLTNTTSQFIGQLTDLLPESERASVIERELEKIRKQPITLAREQLIVSLNEKLEQLKESTDALNDSITLDPLFTGGHSALRMGYYNEGGSAGSRYYDETAGLPTARYGEPLITPVTEPPWAKVVGHYASGFEGIVPGSGSGDTVPFHAMLEPGEHVRITPRGRANDNDNRGYPGPPITINNYWPASALGERRRSQRQHGEGFGRSVAAAR